MEKDAEKKMDLQRQLGGRAVIVRLSKELRINSKNRFLLLIRSSLESGVDMKTNRIVSRWVCQVKCVSLYFFFTGSFQSCRFCMPESILFILQNACLHLVIHGKLVAD